MNYKEIKEILSLEKTTDIEKLFNQAYTVKKEYVGLKVHMRGIIEFSNICDKNCYYCGIRKDNKNVKRFFMTKKEILNATKWIYEKGFGSIVLQSGERTNKEFIKFVDDLIKEIKKLSNDKLGITLSLGEQTKDTYKKWFDLGAHRYLLRIETSNPELYEKLHPSSHKFAERVKCLEYLREIGYQVGTGVMIGLPYQTIDDLANDVLFFKKMDIDMIGMGPYVTHKDTPLYNVVKIFDKEKQLLLALKMIAATRIVLKDINIASTTAIEALQEGGRKGGLKAGANIIMPIVTPENYRRYYNLYENKPGIDMDEEKTFNEIKNDVKEIGEEICLNKWGDSPHYFKRIKK